MIEHDHQGEEADSGSMRKGFGVGRDRAGGGLRKETSGVWTAASPSSCRQRLEGHVLDPIRSDTHHFVIYLKSNGPKPSLIALAQLTFSSSSG